MKKMILAGLALSLFSISTQAQECSPILERLEKQGLSAEALRAFQVSAERKGVLGDVMEQDRIAIVDLSRPAREKRLMIVDLKTGQVTKSMHTSSGRKNAMNSDGSVRDIGPHRPGAHAAPGGLMKIGPQRRLVRNKGLGLPLDGLEKMNASTSFAGIHIQDCRGYREAIANKRYIYRSFGSFCVAAGSMQSLTSELEGSYLYSALPQETRHKLDVSERSKVCQLFENAQDTKLLQKTELNEEFNAQANRYVPSDDMSEAVIPGEEYLGGQSIPGID